MVSINTPTTGRVRLTCSGTWSVDSSTHTLVTYTVRHGEFGLECTCDGYFYRHKCSHITRVLEEMQAEQPRRLREEDQILVGSESPREALRRAKEVREGKAVPTLESFWEV